MTNLNSSHLVKKELLVLNELNVMANEGFAISVIMDKAVELIKDVFDFKNCGVFCLNDDKDMLILKSVAINKDVLHEAEKAYRKILGGKAFIAKGMKIPLYKGSTFSDVIESKKPIVVDREQGLKDYTDNKKLHIKAKIIAKIVGEHNVLRAPLLANNQVFGVLGASKVSEFTKSDIKCITDIASHMALIIRKYSIDKKLADSELKYRTLFQAAGDIILMLNDEGKITEFNNKACELYQCSFQEMLGKDICELDAVLSKKEIMEKKAESLKYGYLVFETKHRKKNGEEFDVLVSVTIIKLDKDTHVQMIIKDVTEIKKLAEYKERERLLDLYMGAIDQAALPVVLWHLGDIVFANKKMTSLTGYTNEELTSMSLRDLVTKKDLPYFDDLCSVLFGYEIGVSSVGELRIVNNRGEEKYVNLNQVKTDMGNGDPIFSTTIVDKNYMSKKLSAIQDLLRETSLTIEGIDHDTT